MNNSDFGKLSTGYTNFEMLRRNGCIYVDKTDLLWDLIDFSRMDKSPIFFSRPRRFGKSLVASTFESWFRHGREYFKGLNLEAKASDEEQECIVISMSFAAIGGDRDLAKDLFVMLKSALSSNPNFMAELDKSALESEDYLVLILEIANKAPESSLVFLIDEYDAPLISRLGNKEEYKRATEIFSSFFNLLKEIFTVKIRFCLLTGVARFSHTSIFSGFNTVEDYSYDPTYAGIYGFTQEELTSYYRPFLEYFAEQQGLSFEALVEKFAEFYDGYSFDPSGEIRVFNPWSVIKSFKNLRTNRYKSFFHYWIDSGDFSKLADTYLNFHFHEPNTQQALHQICEAMQPIAIRYEDLFNSFDYLHQDPTQALIQTGYLTLRTVDGELFAVTPNNEVRARLAEKLLGRYPNLLTNGNGNSRSYQEAAFLNAALSAHDAAAIRGCFNEILNAVSPHSRRDFFKSETSVRDFIFANVQRLGFAAVKEAEGTLGFCDLIISYRGQKGFHESAVFEFKRLGEEQERKDRTSALASLASKAAQQIKEKRYLRASGIGIPSCAYAAVIDSASFEIAKLCLVEEQDG